MSLITSGTVGSVQELLDRVRACIGDVSPGTIVSLTIDVANGGERRVLRLAVKADDNVVDSPANPLHTSPCATPAEHSPAPLCDDTNMVEDGSEVRGQASLNQQEEREELLEALRETTEGDRREGVDDGEEASGDASESASHCSMEGLEESSVPSSANLGEVADSTSSIPSRTDDNIRRSARKQTPIDRLVYEAAKPREVGGTTSKRKRTEALGEASAAAADTTDGESDSSEDGDTEGDSS